MRPYQYTKLLDPSKEIRLLNLLPGEFSDPIRFTMRNASYIPPSIEEPSNSNRISLNELQRTLPPDWHAHETLEGRYIFRFRSGPDGDTSWNHPDPQFNSRLLDDSGNRPVFEPEFEALSYVWGSTKTTETTYIHPSENDDQGTEMKTLEIGTNLATAMRHLRLQDQPRTIWADAMAINQMDENERNEQVKIMGHIYRHARRVVVWLGLEADNSNIAISALEHLGHQIEASKDFWLFVSPDAADKEVWNPQVPLPFNQEEHAAVTALLQRPWFERLWTVPEIQLANDQAVAQCGSRQFQWSLFRRALHLAETKVNLDRDFVTRCNGITRSVVSRKVPVAFVLRRVSRERKCSEPRDKLYAILSLIGPTCAGKIEPQYSISIWKLYQDFFITYLEFSQRLDLLPLVTIRNGSQQNNAQPSWIPDWNDGGSSGLEDQFRHFAAAVSKAHVRYPQDSVLEVTGARTATISTLSEILTAKVGKVIEIMGIKDISADAKYVTGISLVDAYIRTLRSDIFREFLPVDLTAPTVEEAREDILNRLQDLSKDYDEGNLFNIALRVIKWTKMRFVTTTDGHVGYVPFNAQRGESVLLHHIN